MEEQNQEIEPIEEIPKPEEKPDIEFLGSIKILEDLKAIPYEYEWISIREGRQYIPRIGIVGLKIDYTYCDYEPSDTIFDRRIDYILRMKLLDSSDNIITFNLYSGGKRKDIPMDYFDFDKTSRIWDETDCNTESTIEYDKLRVYEGSGGSIRYKPWILPEEYPEGAKIRIEGIDRNTGKVLFYDEVNLVKQK